MSCKSIQHDYIILACFSLPSQVHATETKMPDIMLAYTVSMVPLMLSLLGCPYGFTLIWQFEHC